MKAVILKYFKQKQAAGICLCGVPVPIALSGLWLLTAANLRLSVGGADAARSLVGKWLCMPPDGHSMVAQFGRVEGMQDSNTMVVRWDDLSSAKPSPVTEAHPASVAAGWVAAGWVAGRVSARLQRKFRWYLLT
jgi:hypothetical protein